MKSVFCKKTCLSNLKSATILERVAEGYKHSPEYTNKGDE